MIKRFEIPYYQYLNEESEISQDAPLLAKQKDHLLNLYRYLCLVRMIDTKAIALQRTGKLGTYPSTRGQEAVFVGMGNALEKTDIYVPYYRDMGAMIQRGVKLTQILQYWGGDERGNVFHGETDDFPFSVPIGSQALHAAGAAYAIKYRGEQRAVLASCGDGATSQGDFYEAMNVAGVWKLPVVFAVCNNQWAISVPRQAQTAAESLAQKGIAAGLHVEQVDGNDVIAVQHRIKMALHMAREKGEASVIEMLCYRQSDHTTADDASRYEPKGMREQEWKKEPIARLRVYLEKMQLWNTSQENELLEQCAQEVEGIVAEYLAITPQPVESIFDYLYATLPVAYQAQRQHLIEKEKLKHG